MSELWTISGRNPVSWRIPFYVDWQSDGEALIMSAIPLYQSHLAAVNQLLTLHGRREKKGWSISRTELKAIGEKTPGGNPEIYFSWGVVRPVDRKPQEDRAPRDEFIESLFAAGVGESVEQLTYFWREFCHHAAHTLINKEKPVDMLFLRLHNCPFRANWRTILTQRFRKLGPTLQHSSDEARDYAIKQSGLRDEFFSLDLLALSRKTGTCYRHIEIEHRPKWWKLVRRAEKERMERGPVVYANYFLDSVRRFFKPGIGLYLSWLSQIAKPSVAGCESGHDGSIRFVPNNLAGSLHPASREYCGLAPVVPNKFPRFKPESAAETLLAPDGGVPAVPVVQPQAKDVRVGDDPQPRADVGQSRNGKA